MNVSCIFVSSRSASLQIEDGGFFETVRPYRIRVNGEDRGEVTRVVESLYGLLPDTAYEAEIWEGEARQGGVRFRTAQESCTLDVRRFGAVGDGAHDDTAAIQAAITCCPPKGRVLIPGGRYLITPLFLKSHISVELAQGAELLLQTDRRLFPILPGMTPCGEGELNLGSWEGEAQDMFAAMITGVDVEDVCLYGQGVVDGRAQLSDWWVRPKEKRGAWRGRLLFLCRCRRVSVQGLTFRNSPSWNLHPYFSEELRFVGISVNAPKVSPNTDGFDPESCRHVLLAGAHFSVGDDCIAIKSGKLEMGRTYRTPCEDIDIAHCLMEDGHGGVTVGSEMAGGVKNVRVRDCLMRNTDRGLRVKTRRGRGKDGVIDDIVFDHVQMERVSAPFVVNCMYFCDADGHSDWVQSREKRPVDETTPRVGDILFRNVQAAQCGACAGYFLGLPEQPIGRVALEHVRFGFDPEAQAMQPAMADGVEVCRGRGIVAQYVDELVLRDVALEGQQGDDVDCLEVAHLIKES